MSLEWDLQRIEIAIRAQQAGNYYKPASPVVRKDPADYGRRKVFVVALTLFGIFLAVAPTIVYILIQAKGV
jgi:hypothetical protein